MIPIGLSAAKPDGCRLIPALLVDHCQNQLGAASPFVVATEVGGHRFKKLAVMLGFDRIHHQGLRLLAGRLHLPARR
jgi:hypothetical protein